MVKTQLTWVEIELVDTAGKPVPNVRYRIELPDGQFQEGTLDGNGHARADEIEPGTCWISFPDYDKDSLSRA
jgi:type VI secretion system secreted protein VgrG